jgi:hypothetical protein
MIHQRERATFKRGFVSPGKVATGLFHNSKIMVRRQVASVESLLDLQRSHGNAFVQRLVQRKHHTEPGCRPNVRPLIQRDPFGTGGEAMGTHVARPGDSLSLIAGYPNDGWRERLDQLIAANQELPSIKNRTPDDPQYAWLNIGDVINVPWLPPLDGRPGPGEDETEEPIEEAPPDGAKEPEDTRKAKNIRFSELESESYRGFDPTTRPNTLVVPAGKANSRRIAVKVWPADAVPNLEMADPSVASFSLNSGILDVTGLASGSTNIGMRNGDEVESKLSIFVPPSSVSYSVDFLYVHQTAGTVPDRKRPREARATSKTPRSSAAFSTQLQDVIEKQTGIGFSTGRSEVVRIPDDLSPVQRVWFDKYIQDMGEKPRKAMLYIMLPDLATSSKSGLTIFFMWDLGGDADEIGGFAMRDWSYAVINDHGCSDGSELVHEVVHMLTPETYPSHDKRGLMAPKCPAVDSPRILSARVRAMYGM